MIDSLWVTKDGVRRKHGTRVLCGRAAVLARHLRNGKRVRHHRGWPADGWASQPLGWPYALAHRWRDDRLGASHARRTLRWKRTMTRRRTTRGMQSLSINCRHARRRYFRVLYQVSEVFLQQADRSGVCRENLLDYVHT